MKILITGAAGMLAADVITNLQEAKHEVIQTDINRRLPDIDILDVSNKDKVFQKINDTEPDYVFHLAAETNVDLCEQDADHAFRINALGTENIALACREFGCRLLYISTSSVFNGDKPDSYIESDKPDPVNIYGKSKLQGEIVVQDLLSRYFIIRAGWMVGGWELDKKFVYKIVQKLEGGERELKVVSDKFGSLTFTKDFAANLMKVIETNRYGLYHMVNNGMGSRYDIAVKIVEFIGLKDKVRINSVSSEEFPLPAPRSRSEVLRNHKLDLLGLNNMPFWQESLAEYIRINKRYIKSLDK